MKYNIILKIFIVTYIIYFHGNFYHHFIIILSPSSLVSSSLPSIINHTSVTTLPNIACISCTLPILAFIATAVPPVIDNNDDDDDDDDDEL